MAAVAVCPPSDQCFYYVILPAGGVACRVLGPFPAAGARLPGAAVVGREQGRALRRGHRRPVPRLLGQRSRVCLRRLPVTRVRVPGMGSSLWRSMYVLST